MLAPDGLVTLVYGPQGAISASGAIVDNRVEYRHRHRQASAAKAKQSMLQHARAQLGTKELELVHLTRTAMPAAQASGWVGLVREKNGGAMLARVIVDADPVFPGAVLPLLSYQQLGASELKDTQPIQVRALDPSGEPRQAPSAGIRQTSSHPTGVIQAIRHPAPTHRGCSPRPTSTRRNARSRWIELHPGAGQSTLRLLSGQPIEALRVHLIEPCRELRFETDGMVHTLLPFYLGESCWLDRCGDGISPVVHYCEGEEPPPGP